jgi:glycosyltransferase involved in cell wall biosynthesis
VSPAIVGTDELIENGASGLLILPGDAGTLGAVVRRLLSDSALRGSLARCVRRRFKSDLTRDAMARRVEQLYEQLLEGGPRVNS